jgi:iron complex outermembrane receptor protein
MRRLMPALMAVSVLGMTVLGAAEPEAPVAVPSAEERIEVTATKYPDDPDKIPQSMTVVSGEDLRDRGATDLRTALALVAGVDIAPGGDGGPASAVPEMWGFREFDAYLLVLDGVPWGGAFNPQVSTLSLNDVERIEILRGAAPVVYGSTSFIGVIQVIHSLPGHGTPPSIQVAAGSYGSAAIVSSFDLPTWAGFSSRLSLDAEQRNYRDDRTDFERGHLLWRNRRELGGGKEVHFDLDGAWIDQSPSSPVPRTGAVLATNVPLDANYNPGGAKIDPRRVSASVGFTIPKSYGVWTGIASYAHASTDTLRGFVTDPTGPLFPATGERSTTTIDEAYLDAHVEFTNVPKTQILAGVDYQYGKGHLNGGEINYTIASDGSNPPDGAAIPVDTNANITDTRNFGGLYGYVAWTPDWRWRLEAGLRLNLTAESRDTSLADYPADTFEQGSDSLSETRPGGSAGVTFTAWQHGVDDVRIFTDYRNTYKPAAVDFGLDAGAEMLDPETSESWSSECAPASSIASCRSNSPPSTWSSTTSSCPPSSTGSRRSRTPGPRSSRASSSRPAGACRTTS